MSELNPGYGQGLTDSHIEALALAALPAAGAWGTSSAYSCYSFACLTLFVQYDEAAQASDGAMEFIVEWTPYSGATPSTVPAGQLEWFPLSVVGWANAVLGAQADGILEPGIVQFDPVTAVLEGVIYSIAIPDFAERFRVRYRESGDTDNPGQAAITVRLSVRPCPEGLTQHQQTNITADSGTAGDADWTVSLLSNETADDSDKSFTVPANTEYQILWVWVELVTTATVGDRQLVLEIQDAAADVIGRIIPAEVQAASLSREYMFAPALADQLTGWRDATWLMCPIPSTQFMSAGQILRVYDNNAVAAAADDMVVQVQIASRTV